MEKTEALDSYKKNGNWETVEVVSDKNGKLYPVTLHNIIFKEGEVCILRLCIGGYEADIFVKPLVDGTLDFAIKCCSGRNEGWYSSKNLAECINYMKTWFTDHKTIAENE